MRNDLASYIIYFVIHRFVIGCEMFLRKVFLCGISFQQAKRLNI